MKDTTTLLRESEAMLEGHFLLSSGRHSDRYFQCARLLQYPDRAAAALAGVVERIKADIRAGTLALDAVVGPAMGGIVVAYELGRQLGLPAFFTERDDTGAMKLRRGFSVESGMRILIAEDVVTTGRSSAESAAVLEAVGAVRLRPWPAWWIGGQPASAVKASSTTKASCDAKVSRKSPGPSTPRPSWKPPIGTPRTAPSASRAYPR